LKLYNPFKWHVIEYKNKFIIRKFHLPHLGWSYHYRADHGISDVNSAKTFVSLYVLREYLDDLLFLNKENEVKSIRS